MDEIHCTLEEALSRLDDVAPDAPLLALGQTVLWDEPVKAGVALTLEKMGSKRRFVAGVHDTDYFAKLPFGPREPGRFKAMPHNATTTRDLWSAAGEFSALFGSETVITRQDFLAAGLNLEKIQRHRPGLLDEASEAYGWRGVVALDENPPVVAEMPLHSVFPEIEATLEWAVEETLACIAENDRPAARKQAERLIEIVSQHAGGDKLSLAGYYRNLLPQLYAFASNRVPSNLETTATTELLRFNVDTCDLARFELVDLFLKPETKAIAANAYDAAVRDSEIYTLDRFGTGAIPFDLFIPGKGRGTLRIGNRGIVINSRRPQTIALKRPVTNVRELAEAIESKFGSECVLIGKAVTLIGQLSREFVFVFHETASGYVKYTGALHRGLDEAGIRIHFNPILRLRYRTWDSLNGCCIWFRLPEPFQEPFGAEEIGAPSLAGRWSEVKEEQGELLKRLGEMKRPIDLIRFLDERGGGAWKSLAGEYLSLHERLEAVSERVKELKAERLELYAKLRELKAARVEAERQKGAHFRERIFQTGPSDDDLARRAGLSDRIESLVQQVERTREAIRQSARKQRDIVRDPDILRIHERRRAIELEAELKRMRLIRNAVISSRGIQKAAYRPSAWWFPLVCPSGKWFKNTVESTECYLEPLTPKESKAPALSTAEKSAQSA